MGGKRRGSEAECKAFIGDTGRNPVRRPFPSHTPLVEGDEDGGVADDAAVDSKQDGTGCAIMARCPLPTICTRSPRLNQIL